MGSLIILNDVGRKGFLFFVAFWILAAGAAWRKATKAFSPAEARPAHDRSDSVTAPTMPLVDIKRSQPPAIARFRGTLTKVPNETAGLVFVNAEYRSFSMVDVWKSAVPPAEGQLVDVELDSEGRITSLAVVGAPLTETHSSQPPNLDRTSGAKAYAENSNHSVAAPPVALMEIKRPWRVWRFLRWAFATIVALSLGVYLAWSPLIWPIILHSYPVISVGQAVKAYQDHDLQTFREHVDFTAVLDDASAQALPDFLSKILRSTDITPQLVRMLEQVMFAEESSAKSAQSEPMFRAFINGAFRMLDYDGLGPNRITGNVAHIEVRMSLNGHILPLQVRLKWAVDHWRVVAIENLSNLVDALLAAV
jgi:hypothetical protein